MIDRTSPNADERPDGVVVDARGRPVDGRSDVWSFGCVLFEMISGRRAFGGETMTDVLVAVVTGEPDWSLLS